MDIETVTAHTIYEVIHGSHAYGMALPTSDEDRKGVCIIPDRRYFFGTQSFDQQDGGWGSDKVIYHLPKFMKLAGDCNPNVIELLFCDAKHIIKMTPAGERLRKNAGLFLSRKARHTFTGYAHSQLQRIEGHKRWIDRPPEEPDRSAFTFKKTIPVGPLGTQLAETAKILAVRPQTEAGWFDIDVETFDRSGWDAAFTNWKNYQTWRKNRNPVRSELEIKHTFDTKHASHLVRLLRMGLEIVTESVVRVLRPDAAELLSIRQGGWSYERVIDHARELEEKIIAAEPGSPLPFGADWKRIEMLQMELIEEALAGGEA